MALKGKWKDKVNGVDRNSADDINQVAHAVIELEEKETGGVTQETDPTVPAWAKKPSKPTYTASEVGALPSSTKIPTKTSDLTNDSGFITKSVSDLANYYLKSQTYTKDEVNALVSAIPKFSISVVSSLPTSNISTTTIYLVGGGSGNDLYTEYIYTSGKWEILGSQKVDLTGYAKETWVNTQLSSYLKSSELDAAVETALAEAKASGEFDGADGADGDDGRGITSITRTSGTGAAGTTDTYTITYTDGTKSTFTVYNGTNGTNGKDGTSVAVSKVTESTVSGGTNIVTFSDGKTLNVKNGKDGAAGADGKSAYAYAQDGGFTGTEAEFAEKIAKGDVVISLTKAEFSALTAEDITQYYDDGARAIFVEDGYTNLVPTAIGENGAIFYGSGYLNGYRLTSSGGTSLADGACISGYIPYSNNATIRVAGSRHIADAGGQYVAAYDSSFNLIGVMYTSVIANGTSGTYATRADGSYELIMYTSKISAWKNAAYFRVSCASCVGAELIVTINEEIGSEV